MIAMTVGSESERRSALPLAAAGLVLLALVLTTEAYVWLNLWPLRVSWGNAFVWSLPLLACWLALLPAAARLAGRWPIAPEPSLVRLGGHALASVVFSVVGLSLLQGSDAVFHWTRQLAAPTKLVADLRYTLVHLHLGIAVYWVTVGGAHALAYYHRYREGALVARGLQAQLADAQLEVLRARLEPHFLFNTLNSITVLVRRDPAAAERMLQRLSRLLRMALDRHARAEVPLDEELSFVREYLEIQRVRFPDRLVYEFLVPPELGDAAVPCFLLQPLVENAVQHAVAVRARGGRVEIAAAREGAVLTVTVRDDGPGTDSGSRSGRLGVGLSNTRERLATLYGNRQGLELVDRPEGGCEARVDIPYRRLEPGAETVP
jgi:signal transduction histidine kinase